MFAISLPSISYLDAGYNERICVSSIFVPLRVAGRLLSQLLGECLWRLGSRRQWFCCPPSLSRRITPPGCSYYEIRFSERLVLVTWLVIRYCENARPVVFSFREFATMAVLEHTHLKGIAPCLCSSFNSFWCWLPSLSASGGEASH